MPSPDYTIHEIDPSRRFISVTYHVPDPTLGDQLYNFHEVEVENWADPEAIKSAIRMHGEQLFGSQLPDAEPAAVPDPIAALLDQRQTGD